MKLEYQIIGGLEFLTAKEDQISKTVNYDDLSSFIRDEFLKSRIASEAQNEEILELYDRLENLKEEEKKKEEEYNLRQKQVTTYLECRKSFFGKIRYFFQNIRRRLLYGWFYFKKIWRAVLRRLRKRNGAVYE